MDETDEQTPVVMGDEFELNQILGLFDVPAFARRGHELEYALDRLDRRLGRERAGLLDMVKLRLRQWAAVATGPDDWRGAFAAPVASLYALAAAEAPAWADRPAHDRRRRAAARDLAASVARFNRRWLDVLDGLRLDAVNSQVEQYNRYYVLEKECVLGSARLAARFFVPKPPVTRGSILARHPALPAVALDPGLA
jgi:hypothetical protein